MTVKTVLRDHPAFLASSLDGRPTQSLRSFRTLLRSLAYFKAVRPVLRLRQPSLTILSVSLTCNWPRIYLFALARIIVWNARRTRSRLPPRLPAPGATQTTARPWPVYGRESRAWM